jgi:biopolymer transport protein ExbD
MAELNLSTGKTGGRQLNKLPIRVDLTAMVDLAFLLITFFILTTTLNKQREIPLAMPAPGPNAAVAASSTMTICLGKNNQAVWYLGMAEKPLIAPKLISYGKDMDKAVAETIKQVYAATGKNLFVVIKPSEHSVYKNLVNTLDEMNISKVSSYAIAKISATDVALLKQKQIY